MKEKIFNKLVEIKNRLLYPKLYGVRTDIGEFGAGKTFNVFLKGCNYKKNRNSYIIANVPYGFIDLFYSSKQDLLKIYKFLLFYAAYLSTPLGDGNDPKKRDWYLLKQNYKFQSIILLTDEIGAYFNPSATGKEGKIPTQVLTVLKQARKINLLVENVDQILSKVNKDFRANTPDIRNYYKGLRLIQRYKDYFLKTNDSTDIKSEEVADEKGNLLMNLYLNPKIKKLLNRSKFTKDNFYDMEYLSYFMTGFGNYLEDIQLFDFLNQMYSEKGFMKEFKITQNIHSEIMEKVKKKLDIEKDFYDININYNGEFYTG